MIARWAEKWLSGLLVGACVLAASGCRTASVARGGTTRQVRAASALAGGNSASLPIERRFGGVIRDAHAEARMADIGRRVAQHTNLDPQALSYLLLNSNDLNAISLPEGRIYLTRGLYARLEQDSWLAAAIAHELAHIAHRDGYAPRCRTSHQALARELAADARALDYLHAAEYPIQAMSDLLQRIRHTQPDEWIAARLQVAVR